MGMRNVRTATFLIAALFVLIPSYVLGYTTGWVADAYTQRPVSGAIITMNDEVVRSDENGRFTLKGTGTAIRVRACGYLRADQTILPSLFTAPVEIRLKPFTPKALYLTYYGIGDRTLRGAALKLIEQTELNALVIDVKGDRGVITYKSDIPLVSQIGAQKQVIVKDIKGLLASLKEKGIYTIARIVVFKDDILGEARPELAIKSENGGVWRDRENLIWLDPSKRAVWDYNINIAVEAASNGFDEIQFDYVRFPDKKGLKYGVPNNEENRVKYISGFLMEARRRLAPYNVFVAADIFGYVSWNRDDTNIGQRLDNIAGSVDYISLMLYPSGFQFGIPGYRNPVAHPYEIVYLSLKKSLERAKIPSVRFRPWLQAFKDYAFDKRHFNGPEIRCQIKATDEFGSDGWMLWNPRNVYTADGLKKQSAISKSRAKLHGQG